MIIVEYKNNVTETVVNVQVENSIKKKQWFDKECLLNMPMYSTLDNCTVSYSILDTLCDKTDNN